MDLSDTSRIAATGLRAQSLRMRIIAENIANADSVATTAGGDPYRRQMIQFRANPDGVAVAGIARDRSAFVRRYEPGHPAADAAGYVLRPNVSLSIEQADMKEAQRSYSANLSAIEAARAMAMRTIDLLK